jgi:type II secretory pathway component PulF
MKQFLWLLFVGIFIIGGWCGIAVLCASFPHAAYQLLLIPWGVGSIVLGGNLYRWSPEGRRMARKRKEFQSYLDSIEEDAWLEE